MTRGQKMFEAFIAGCNLTSKHFPWSMLDRNAKANWHRAAREYSKKVSSKDKAR